MKLCPRPEHPRPHLYRPEWINLNGSWSFSFDFGKSGFERGLHRSTQLDKTITIPFCPESELSGIGHRDFLESVWYQRVIKIEADWIGKQILLHFGAVDYEALVYIDGKRVGVHYGGSASFSFNITNFVGDGEIHNLVIHAKDETRSSVQGGGKQSLDFHSVGCFYARVTGIWQTVWMEAVRPGGLSKYHCHSDIDNQRLIVQTHFTQMIDSKIKVLISHGHEIIAEQTRHASEGGFLEIALPKDIKLWSPDEPNLYDVFFEISSADDQVVDIAEGYLGIRKIHIDDSCLYLNNEKIFLRFVLDQGYYEEGIWTAKSDGDLRADIELGKAAGFNGARLHQKVFEERYHYWADKLGYLTWAEYPSWGLSMKSDLAARNFLNEWKEIVSRDKSHPSIIAWTPLNETWDLSDPCKHHRLHREVYDLTKLLDPTRPVNGASGGCQVITDIYAVHNYEQDPDKFFDMLLPNSEGCLYATLGDKEVAYSGQPYFVDEFGGIKWIARDEVPYAEDSWGYGTPPLTDVEFLKRLEGLVEALLKLPHLSGYCYTQLTDVEQEQNGIYSYDRSEKFDISIIRQIFLRTPVSS